MFFEFQKGNKEREVERNLRDVFGEEAVAAGTCQRWLVKFLLGDFALKDVPKSGRSSDVSEDVLLSMIRTNYTLTSPEQGFNLGIHQNTAFYCIKRLGFVFKFMCLGATQIKLEKFNGQDFDLFFKSCLPQKGTIFGLLGDWR
ncbi:histone-lysine N-methyltransferase SETMAR [Trichonephila clavipes]|nr:histone-lysine N-methyltransferase SETMAR [Trichonephila clavipes]